jgi:hypothetical protein
MINELMSVEIANRSNVIEFNNNYIINLNFNELLIYKNKVWI